MGLPYRGIEQDFRERIQELDPQGRILRASEVPFYVLRPGDLVQFGYWRDTQQKNYQGLVVATRRSGGRGYRVTKEGNTILQVLIVPGLSDDVFQFVINTLYKNRTLSRYLSLRKRSSEADKKINYGYLKNVGREETELSEQFKESTLARRLLGREKRLGLIKALNEGEFKTFRVEKSYDVFSISLLDPELAQ